MKQLSGNILNKKIERNNENTKRQKNKRHYFIRNIYISTEEIKKKMNEEKEFMRNSKEGFIKYIHLHTSKQQGKQTNDYC